MRFQQRFAWLITSCLLASPVFADTEPGPARLVADLEAGGEPAYQAISGFLRVGDRAVFTGTGNEGIPSLWITDGTAEGTIPLAAVCPPCGYGQPLGSTGSVAFYRLDSEETTIWRTDGTPQGTFPITSGLTAALNRVHVAALAGGRLFFDACSAELGCELWSSDGSVAGTAPVGELVPGPEGAFISQLAAAGGRAFLTAEPEGGTALDTALWIADEHGLRRLAETPEARALAVQGSRAWLVARGAPSGGLEVWTSDGTAAGTQPVTSFGPADPFPTGHFQGDPLPEIFSLTLLDGRAYFMADDGAHGLELWSAGPRPSGARRVTNIRGRYGAFGSVFKAGDRIVFLAASSGSPAKLWTSRGDLGSSVQLTGCAGGCPAIISPLAPVSPGRFVFYGRNRESGGIFVTDGTAAGTRLLRRVTQQHSLSLVAPVDGRVLIETTEEYESGDLWVTDGTAAGTFLAAHGGPGWSHYYGWGGGRLQAGSANGRIVFPGLVPGDQGSEVLWRSDGSPAGTAPVTASQAARSSFPQVLAPFRDGLLVQTCSPEGAALWFVQGSSADLLMSESGYCTAPSLSSPVVLGETAVFLRYEDGQSVWRTDGTPEGTAVLMPRSAHPLALARLGEKAAVWLAIPTITGFLSELWLTDGTPAGTRKQLDLPADTNMSGLAAVAGRLWFYDWLEGAEPTMRPWVSDGTPAGTHPLAEATGFTAGGGFTEMGGRVWFPFGPAGSPVWIWSTDGTPAGTRPAVTAASGVAAPQILTAIGDRLYLAAPRTEGPAERLLPWVSDGTDEGTELLIDAVTDTSFMALGSFLELDGRVLFAASDRQHGDELWSTDGTPEGTARLLDIAPGLLGSDPRDLTVWNGRLWFRARDGVHGMELWSSDGTAEGTRMFQDIAAGASWSTPMALTVTEDGLYFSAHDGAHGRELWVLYPF